MRISYLVEVSANDRTQNGGWLHDQYEVPVNQGLRFEGVAAVDVEEEVGHSTAHYGEVGKSNSILCWKTCKESRRVGFMQTLQRYQACLFCCYMLKSLLKGSAGMIGSVARI